MALDESEWYGYLAEFATPEALLEAARRAERAGYRQIDAYSPFPVEGLTEALGFRRTRVPLIVFVGGILGGTGAFLMQVWANLDFLPGNIGGRPHFSWPSFIPITFELTILAASFAAVFGMLALNGLPMPYHPVFNVEAFRTSAQDKFFLLIRSIDPRFDVEKTRRFLEEAHAEGVYEVEP